VIKKGVCTFVLLFALGLVFVTSVDAAGSHVVERGDTLSHIARLHGTTWPALAEYNAMDNPHLIFPREIIRIPSGLYRVWIVEELGETIVAAGKFWASWWGGGGSIDWMRYVLWGEERTVFPPTSINRHYTQISCLSGFSGMDDIWNYLLQYFTEAWLERRFDIDNPPFIEYGGSLFMEHMRYGAVTTRWNASPRHILIEQEGGHAVVQTTALIGGWGIMYAEGMTLQEAKGQGFIEEVTYYFTFMDGRIDSIISSIGFSVQFAL